MWWRLVLEYIAITAHLTCHQIYVSQLINVLPWHEVTGHDVMWCDRTWCDRTWCDRMWHDVTWCDVTGRDITIHNVCAGTCACACYHVCMLSCVHLCLHAHARVYACAQAWMRVFVCTCACVNETQKHPQFMCLLYYDNIVHLILHLDAMLQTMPSSWQTYQPIISWPDHIIELRNEVSLHELPADGASPCWKQH